MPPGPNWAQRFSFLQLPYNTANSAVGKEENARFFHNDGTFRKSLYFNGLMHVELIGTLDLGVRNYNLMG